MQLTTALSTSPLRHSHGPHSCLSELLRKETAARVAHQQGQANASAAASAMTPGQKSSKHEIDYPTDQFIDPPLSAKQHGGLYGYGYEASLDTQESRDQETSHDRIRPNRISPLTTTTLKSKCSGTSPLAPSDSPETEADYDYDLDTWRMYMRISAARNNMPSPTTCMTLLDARRVNNNHNHVSSSIPNDKEESYEVDDYDTSYSEYEDDAIFELELE